MDTVGETIELFGGTSRSTTGLKTTTTISVREQLLPRMSVNDILLASDHPSRSIVRIARGEGYAQYGGLPVVVESNFHITKEAYGHRKEFPWPTNIPGTFVPTDDADLLPPPKSKPNITSETL